MRTQRLNASIKPLYGKQEGAVVGYNPHKPGRPSHTYPKLHNAAWPGVVGKGDDSEPPIDLDTMLDLTAAASVDGVNIEGVDLFLSDPHVSIDASDDDIKRLADKVQSRDLVIGSVVAPIWEPTGRRSAMGSDEERERFLTQVRKGCSIAKKLRELGARRAVHSCPPVSRYPDEEHRASAAPRSWCWVCPPPASRQPRPA